MREMPEGAEVQTCGRRMSEYGPWEMSEHLDWWETNRWLSPEMAAAELAKKREAAAAEYEATKGRYQVHYSNDDRAWLSPLPIPRTCSFCGSVHPEDLIKLLEAGWEIDRAKSYKLSVHPPGWSKSIVPLPETEFVPDGPAQPKGWSPTPCVKFYMQHVTSSAQAERLEQARRSSLA